MVVVNSIISFLKLLFCIFHFVILYCFFCIQTAMYQFVDFVWKTQFHLFCTNSNSFLIHFYLLFSRVIKFKHHQSTCYVFLLFILLLYIIHEFNLLININGYVINKLFRDTYGKIEIFVFQMVLLQEAFCFYH